LKNAQLGSRAFLRLVVSFSKYGKIKIMAVRSSDFLEIVMRTSDRLIASRFLLRFHSANRGIRAGAGAIFAQKNVLGNILP